MRDVLLRLRDSWWWQIPPDRLRVMLSILDLLKATGGCARIDTNSLSTALRVSPSSVARALQDLVAQQLVHISSTRGRGGGLLINQIGQENNPGDLPDRLKQTPTTSHNSTLDENLNHQDSNSGDLPDRFRSTVLDLQKSPSGSESDPSVNSSERTPTLEIETNTPVPAAATPMKEPTPTSNPQPTKRRSADPAKIDRHAWAAADGMRARIMRYQPSNVVGTKKWDGQSGARLSWAHVFDLMARIDKRGWMEISEVIRWLFPDDSADPVHAPGISKFVILSPDSLREKWDNVRAAQVRARAGAQPRTPDGRPDRQAERPTKRWGTDWDGGGES